MKHLKNISNCINVIVLTPRGIDVPCVPQSNKKKGVEEGEDEPEAPEVQFRHLKCQDFPTKRCQCTFCAPVWQEQDEEEEEHEASESYLYGINNKCQYFPP